MAKRIQIIKISDLPGFDAKNFCMKPNAWNFDFELYYDPLEVKTYQAARKKAAEIDGICIALIHDSRYKDYTFGAYCLQGKSSRFILFNAKVCDASQADVIGVFSTEDTPSEKAEVYLKYEPGEVYLKFEPGTIY